MKEWRSRYREEKMKVIQLELQLAQKVKECGNLAEGCKGMKERVWDQVQEINQLLPEGDERSRDWEELSRRYDRDATEEDYYLNLLAEQVQELKKRKQQQEEQEKEKAQVVVTMEAEKEEPKMVSPREEKVQWPGQEEEEEKRNQERELSRLQADMAVALEEKVCAAKRVEEMEGHMENMRAVISVYEAKKKTQNGLLKELEARVAELDGENQQLRSLLAKQLGEHGKVGKLETGLFPREKVVQFLAEMEEEYCRMQKENSVMLTENEALKQEAEEAVRVKLQFQAVSSGVVRRSVIAWKKVVIGLECALAKLEQVVSGFLDKARPLREAILSVHSGVTVNGVGSPKGENNISRNGAKPPLSDPQVLQELENSGVEKTQLQDGSSGQVKLRPKSGAAENKVRVYRRSSDLEKELWDLKQNNSGLMKQLTKLSREREKLQGELQILCQPRETSPHGEASVNVVEDLKQTVESLSQQLAAEKEESKRLRLGLESQKKEMVVVRDSFLKQMTTDSIHNGNENLGNSILRELHWKLDNVVKKQNEALQLVSEMEEENRALEADRSLLADHGGHEPFAVDEKARQDVSFEASDAIGDNWKARQRMDELEKGLQELREVLEAVRASLGERGEEVTQLKQLLDQLITKMAELRREEEEALRKHEKVRGMLSVRAQALGEQLAALQEKYEEANGEAARQKEALASEKRTNEDLLAEAAEHEEEVDELRGKSQRLEIMTDKLNKKVDDLSKTCQDREGKVGKFRRNRQIVGKLGVLPACHVLILLCRMSWRSPEIVSS